MEELFPLLFVIFIWSLVGSTIRKSVKGAKGGQQSAKKRSSAAPEQKPVVKTSPDVQAAPSGPSHPHAAPGWGSLGGAETEGVDPCHDDPVRVPVGSLWTAEPEGTDPCHDDPYGMPVGSLTAESPEGTDPCHPDLRPDHPESGFCPESEGSGLNLRFSGNEIVQGFVWGEILNRKRA